MRRLGKYNESDRLSELIADDYPVLLVLSRFGIGLGVGDKSIKEVCDEYGVDTVTFLALVNSLHNQQSQADLQSLSVDALLTYLHSSHDYFLEYRLPMIRKKLASAVDGEHTLTKAIFDYFDGYAAEVRRHMMYEEKTVFPYVCQLLSGKRADGYGIDIFSKRHDQVEARLTEFKQIMIKYYPGGNTNEINDVMFDIFSAERDLASHNAIEDRLFVPAIRLMEKQLESKV